MIYWLNTYVYLPSWRIFWLNILGLNFIFYIFFFTLNFFALNHCLCNKERRMLRHKGGILFYFNEKQILQHPFCFSYRGKKTSLSFFKRLQPLCQGEMRSILLCQHPQFHDWITFAQKIQIGNSRCWFKKNKTCYLLKKRNRCVSWLERNEYLVCIEEHFFFCF